MIEELWSNQTDRNTTTSVKGRFLARPKVPTGQAKLGLQPLGLGSKRDGFVYVPTTYQASRPAPLVLMLHGAGRSAEQGLAPFQHLADEFGLILLAIDSREQTWDVISGRYGSDIAFIDQALEQTFNCYVIDLAHIAIEGFSDGASYALGVGITNGDLFTHVIAFSPGFIAPGEPKGLPHLFISHGTEDNILPINLCSRKIVPQLQHAGYDVQYREFNGAHKVPEAIAREALDWFTRGGIPVM